jgi:GrpB-like predicted nucleotidyltransferase (UPF0157 family)
VTARPTVAERASIPAMSLHFEREAGIRDFIEFRRRDIFEELAELVPYAELEHVGSTAITGGWTSGDVDVQVRVEANRFAEVTEELTARFERVGGDGKALLELRHEGRGVRLYLTSIDGPHDVHFLHRDLLREQPLLRERYDAIKRKFLGGAAEAYAEAKAAFWAEWTRDLLAA